MKRYFVAKAKNVTQGDWVSVRKVSNLFTTGLAIKRYYVARNEGPHPALSYHILWLLDPEHPAKEAIRWTRNPNDSVLVERPF